MDSAALARDGASSAPNDVTDLAEGQCPVPGSVPDRSSDCGTNDMADHYFSSVARPFSRPAKESNMTFNDRNNPNRRGMQTGIFAGIAIAFAVISVVAIYWVSSQASNTVSNNSGTTPATTSSAPPASNNATTGSGGAAR